MFFCHIGLFIQIVVVQGSVELEDCAGDIAPLQVRQNTTF